MKLNNLSITDRLPKRFNQDEADRFPEDILGSTIVKIGMPKGGNSLEGGGLAIEYIPSGSQQSHRLVMSFNELGMWIHAMG